ncbi:hypothetical protein Tco_1190275, partial [Tanacetum coccineum]
SILRESSFSSSVTMATRSVWMSTSMGITASVPQTRLKGVSSGFPLALFDVLRPPPPDHWLVNGRVRL